MTQGALIVLLAAATAATTGFGFNLVAAPLLTFLYPAQTVVEATLILGVFTSGLLAAHPAVRARTDWRLVGGLFAASLAGMPLGAAVLLGSGPRVIKIAIAVLTAAFAASRLAGVRPAVRPASWHVVAAGVLSGVLSTSTSLNGLPIAFLLLAWNAAKDEFRSTAIPFIFLATLASVVLLLASSSVPGPTIGLALRLLPPVVAGAAIGAVLAGRLTDRSFERGVLGFLAAVGVLAGLQALR